MLKKTFGVGFRGEIEINKCIQDAAVAEQLGYCDCWISEDYYHGGAFSMATACAAETKKIKLGIGVLNPFTRHPALIAMEAAAINAYSNGRFMVGLGASNAVWIEQQMGIPFQKVLPMLRETITIMRKMFKGDTVNFNGNMFHVSNVHLSVPVDNPIPIVLGVKSENMLRLAAEQADGVLLSAGVSLPLYKMG